MEQLGSILILTKKDEKNEIIGLDISTFANLKSTISMLRDLVSLLEDKKFHSLIEYSVTPKVLVTAFGEKEAGTKICSVDIFNISSYYSPITTQQIFAKAADLLEESSFTLS